MQLESIKGLGGGGVCGGEGQGGGDSLSESRGIYSADCSTSTPSKYYMIKNKAGCLGRPE